MALEGRYLVPWGCREMGLVAGGSLAFAAGFILLGSFHSPFWLVGLLPVAAIGGLGVLFFRNPRRTLPAGPGLFVSPADGRVTEVTRVEEGEFIGGPALKVGIFLSIFNVHLNRSPCSGRVAFLKHRDGLYLDARNPASSRENESQAIGILRDGGDGAEGLRVLVRQVSGAIARRIVCPLREGDPVARGRIVGMIKFGSRTELFVAVPASGPPPEVLVQVGDAVKAGETVLLRLGSGRR
jgi:phosphatidylserine decarboxylase